MFKIEAFEVNGFWHRFDAICKFNPSVNIIIGRNGTGKTTFMNILHSVLTVDIEALAENDFNSAKVILSDGKKKKTVSVAKPSDQYSASFIEYKISNKKYMVRLMPQVDRIPSMLKRRLQEEAQNIKNELNSLVFISAISVYRLRNDDDYEVRDRHGARIMSPVDFRLNHVLARLVEFQLALSERAKKISNDLQKKVLASVLYDEEDAAESGYEINFNREKEQERLITAYTQLNSIDISVKRKISFHVGSIDKCIASIEKGEDSIDIKPLEALRKTRKIIDLSLQAKKDTQLIYSHIDLFLEVIKEFISDKKFTLNSGKLVILNSNNEEIVHSKLSSGEKQLIILMTEALLQNKEQHLFLADEPELSLHIAWQRNIIPAIVKINPNAQVIVATHSPEVASKYRNFIFDMESIVSD